MPLENLSVRFGLRKKECKFFYFTGAVERFEGTTVTTTYKDHSIDPKNHLAHSSPGEIVNHKDQTSTTITHDVNFSIRNVKDNETRRCGFDQSLKHFQHGDIVTAFYVYLDSDEYVCVALYHHKTGIIETRQTRHHKFLGMKMLEYGAFKRVFAFIFNIAGYILGALLIMLMFSVIYQANKLDIMYYFPDQPIESILYLFEESIRQDSLLKGLIPAVVGCKVGEVIIGNIMKLFLPTERAGAKAFKKLLKTIPDIARKEKALHSA